MMARKLAAALVLTAALAAGCGGTKKAGMAVLKVRKATFQIVIPSFGELQAAKSTPIVVPPESRWGLQTISWMAPEYSLVKKDEVVIRLASTNLVERLRIEQAEMDKLNLEIGKKQKQLEKDKTDLHGQIEVTSIQRKLADVYAARDELIFPKNKIIEDAIDLEYQNTRERHFERKRDQMEKRITAELQLLESKANTRRVQMKQIQDQLNNLEIKAPQDGMLVINKYWSGEKYRVGMNAYPGQKLGSLPDLTQMEAKLFVLESEAAGLKESLPVSLTLDFEPGRVFTGKVIGIDTIAKPLGEDSPLKYFEAKVALDITDPLLMKPGVQVRASIFVEKQADVLAVPNQALVFEQDKAFLLVKNSARVEKRAVETGARSLTLTIITKGLSDGEAILLGNPATASGGKLP
ncbi:MAG: HlyD family efflux transporter periplasmic adaptor subunit [Candidatus Aminicenantes bacterium]|nr:MAG: HlyD family efflux transporter periplasmic adaptor subunit [Candidatus Aminicenantes bacterium]